MTTTAITDEEQLRALLMRPGDTPVVVVWIDPTNELNARFRATFEGAADTRDDFIGAIVDVRNANALYERLEPGLNRPSQQCLREMNL